MIEAHNLTKVFPARFERLTLFKKILSYLNPKSSVPKEFVAVNSISFSLPKGQILGIVGKNGAGKTTLLRLLSNIYMPSSGNCRISDRFLTLLQLGNGFIQDISVSDNIFLYGAIIGLSKKQLLASYNRILEFAELEDFEQFPLRDLSNGMKARLGFSIIIQSHAPILILDEIHSAGDYKFAIKCNEAFDSWTKKGKTIIIASHDLTFLKKFCNKILYLRKGEQADFGEPKQVIEHYLADN